MLVHERISVLGMRTRGGDGVRVNWTRARQHGVLWRLLEEPRPQTQPTSALPATQTHIASPRSHYDSLGVAGAVHFERIDSDDEAEDCAIDFEEWCNSYCSLPRSATPNMLAEVEAQVEEAKPNKACNMGENKSANMCTTLASGSSLKEEVELVGLSPVPHSVSIVERATGGDESCTAAVKKGVKVCRMSRDQAMRQFDFVAPFPEVDQPATTDATQICCYCSRVARMRCVTWVFGQIQKLIITSNY